MTKRLHRCRTCTPEEGGKFTLPRGFTRHKDRRCSRCRRWGAPIRFSTRGRAA